MVQIYYTERIFKIMVGKVGNIMENLVELKARAKDWKGLK